MTEQMKIIVITGTPASGKTTLADKVAARIGNATVIHANDLVKAGRLFSSRTADGTMIANMRKLHAEIEREIRRSRSPTVIVEGHLLCDMRIKNAIAIVVREHLLTLEKRMKKRGYSAAKIKENITAEAIDYCGLAAQKNYRQVIEVLNGGTAASDVTKIIGGMKRRRGKGIEILHELIPFTKRKGWN
jgi:adenylate kinase